MHPLSYEPTSKIMPTRGKKAAAEPVPEPVAEPEPPPPPPPEPVVKHISVAAAFHEAQLSFAKHRKCVEALQAASPAMDQSYVHSNSKLERNLF